MGWAGLHTLRHTAASRLFIQEGWNAKQVSAFLGHHSAGFTLAVYVHLLADDLPDPAEPSYVENIWRTDSAETPRNGEQAPAGASAR